MILNGNLYALLSLDGDYAVYKYGDDKFVYDNKWNNKLVDIKTSYFLITAKETVGNSLYFSAGLLYVTDDMKNLSVIEAGDRAIITDLIKYNGTVYALGYKKNDNSFHNYVFKVNLQNKSEIVAEFDYDAPASAFDYSDGCFWFGFGYYDHDNAFNGTVAKAEYNIIK